MRRALAIAGMVLASIVPAGAAHAAPSIPTSGPGSFSDPIHIAATPAMACWMTSMTPQHMYKPAFIDQLGKVREAGTYVSSSFQAQCVPPSQAMFVTNILKHAKFAQRMDTGLNGTPDAYVADYDSAGNWYWKTAPEFWGTTWHECALPVHQEIWSYESWAELEFLYNGQWSYTSQAISPYVVFYC